MLRMTMMMTMIMMIINHNTK